MKGKKTDPEFVASFIQESVLAGAQTPDEIVARAKKMIIDIDEEIKAIELNKKKRTKLLDVIASFEIVKKDRVEEAKLLPFFKLNYHSTCKSICVLIRMQGKLPNCGHGILDAEELQNFYFSVKQLCEAKIIENSEGYLTGGERFVEYMKFVLQEDIHDNSNSR